MRSSASRLSSFSSRDSLWNRMPDQISVSEFIAETTEDYNSPTTSSFTTRLHNCRNTVTLLEEALDQDRTALQKVKKSVKAIYNSGQAPGSEPQCDLHFGFPVKRRPKGSQRRSQEAI
ncbi:arf-GAP with SH3 domain, ANK repeat and PH domain-containing protein 1 isoform X7 [Cavia porcellus]|uniref:arf-GAP with SH3 domain, ANK repeat and PH domain-containing protein 1 isoform X7 n=1 Tax=Cavia porcellus TaxID=10141 RepID=UPI002FDFBA68